MILITSLGFKMFSGSKEQEQMFPKSKQRGQNGEVKTSSGIATDVRGHHARQLHFASKQGF